MCAPHARARRLVPLVLCAAVLGACADRQPTAFEGMDAPDLPARALQAFDCTANVQSGTLRCEPARTGTGLASGVLVGGQNTYVTMASSNFGYKGEVFQIDVTVQNLMNEAIGTPDGVVADPQGIQVFFSSEPATSGGTGEVTLLNATGTGFFTAPAQPYFAYPEILDKDEVSSPLTWRFGVPSTVTAFVFTVLIETDVQYLLVVNEVMANPSPTLDTDQEWVELYNAGSRPVDLQGLVIADSAASGRRPYHLIASSVVVAPGGYAVLGNSTNTTLNGGVPVDYAYGASLAFANSLDAFKVSRVFGTDTLTVDRTQYANAGVSAQSGVSRELKNPALDNSNMDGSNWASALVTAVYGSGGRGTPKAQNSTYTP
jgi:Lamin Tail Domain